MTELKPTMSHSPVLRITSNLKMKREVILMNRMTQNKSDLRNETDEAGSRTEITQSSQER